MQGTRRDLRERSPTREGLIGVSGVEFVERILPCLTLATATLCVACFMDRHPQYLDSVVQVMVVDMKGKRGMNENGDLVAGEIVSETIISPRESLRRHERRSSPRNEKKAFENGFPNDSFGGTNVNRCLTEDFTNPKMDRSAPVKGKHGTTT